MNAKAASPATPASRRQVLLLGGLLAVLGVLVLFQVLPMFGSGGVPSSPAPAATNVTPAPASGTGPEPATRRDTAGGRRAANANAKGGPVEEVALAKLQQPWPEPTSSRRNPFTMTAEPPPAPPPGQATKPVVEAPIAQAPPGPPPP